MLSTFLYHPRIFFSSTLMVTDFSIPYPVNSSDSTYTSKYIYRSCLHSFFPYVSIMFWNCHSRSFELTGPHIHTCTWTQAHKRTQRGTHSEYRETSFFHSLFDSPTMEEQLDHLPGRVIKGVHPLPPNLVHRGNFQQYLRHFISLEFGAHNYREIPFFLFDFILPHTPGS